MSGRRCRSAATSHVLATPTGDGSDGIVEGTSKKTVSEQRAQALGGRQTEIVSKSGLSVPVVFG